MAGLLRVFPTSTEDYLYVDGLKDGDNLFEIISSSGQLVLDGHLDSLNNNINVSEIVPGIYYLNLNVGGKQTLPLKFIKIE